MFLLATVFLPHPCVTRLLCVTVQYKPGYAFVGENHRPTDDHVFGVRFESATFKRSSAARYICKRYAYLQENNDGRPSASDSNRNRTQNISCSGSTLSELRRASLVRITESGL
ncbi:hypothetical protein BDY19DRAFT_977910 [Irpex rosettiformis]|uniref:Uncharacterized protein n=1 Tax=Irpex rosettiformis TaxID=378272 RepID=A0ACB8TNF6_9APHY|nr:hypothetical protein BDY19DRAFT_977910 [Irpex rosettiformis]